MAHTHRFYMAIFKVNQGQPAAPLIFRTRVLIQKFVGGMPFLMPATRKQEAQLMLTNLRDAFRGQSRSPNIVPFHMLGIVSYQFLPRNTMRKRGLCCRPVSVCPYVCHDGGLYPDARRYRQTSFSARLSHDSSFLTRAPIFNSQGNPFFRGCKIHGGFCDFRLKSLFILEMVRDRPMVAMER